MNISWVMLPCNSHEFSTISNYCLDMWDYVYTWMYLCHLPCLYGSEITKILSEILSKRSFMSFVLMHKVSSGCISYLFITYLTYPCFKPFDTFYHNRISKNDPRVFTWLKIMLQKIFKKLSSLIKYTEIWGGPNRGSTSYLWQLHWCLRVELFQ